MVFPSFFEVAPASGFTGLATSTMSNNHVAQVISQLHHATLSNGAKLVYYRMAGAPRLAVRWYITGGNQLDEVLGQTDVLDRLLMKGTTQRNAEQIAVAIDSLSLDVDFHTGRDCTVMSATLLPEDLEPSLALMSELLFDSTLDELSREVEKLTGEIAMDLDSPKARASDLLSRTLWGDSPYGVTSSVLLDNLPRINQLDALKTLYRRTYQPQRLIISVCGDLPVEQVISALEVALPARNETFPTFELSPSIGQQLATHSIGASYDKSILKTTAREDANQCNIYKSWLAPAATHPDLYALQVMNAMLGAGGLSSRLFLELRDKQGLAYNVRSSLDAYKHRGVFTLYIGTEPSNTQKCLKGFEVECQKLMDTPPSAQELDDTKRNLLGRRAIYLETAHQWAGFIGGSFIIERPLEEVVAYEAKIEAVTAMDVQRVAQQVFNQAAVVSIVGPAHALPTSLTP
jgi:zinc protease